MAPLDSAIRVEFSRRLPGGVFVYQGYTDNDWTVLAIPNGGYILGLMIESSMQHQSSSLHPDPIHVTAHFMRSTIVGPFEVHINVLKTGKGLTNLSLQFIQNTQVRVLAHIIHGVLEAPVDTPGPSLTISPPSPYARRIPMHTHPANCPQTAPRQKWTYKNRIAVASDPVYVEKASTPQKGLEFGMYITMKDEEARITTPGLAFLADVFEAMDEHIPGIHQSMRAVSWAPTIVMTLEFKFPIPRPSSSDHSRRTVAVFSSGKFMNDPQGRHDTYVEVWTAPSNIAEGEVKEDWKETQRCIAVSTQMALVMPGSVNLKLGTRETKL
ncbi:hypothetical protein EIP91_011602 [Steccherinum ochraceum]|uniref:Acyl-CoA thioesterase-like N-terminal HotDog domain-containing protein n=1 Tax=Steccherinum ochraceum TaxID=92696 RepID=A0A4V2MWZ2_9APHY|nr:hypothetical protein EIP91_011602 [Steccherinum ochraceum]